MMPSISVVERFGNELGLSTAERDRLFRTAPVTTRDYYNLCDVIHDPDATYGETAHYAESVAAEIEDRDVPESSLAVTGLYATIEAYLKDR